MMKDGWRWCCAFTERQRCNDKLCKAGFQGAGIGSVTQRSNGVELTQTRTFNSFTWNKRPSIAAHSCLAPSSGWCVERLPFRRSIPFILISTYDTLFPYRFILPISWKAHRLSISIVLFNQDFQAFLPMMARAYDIHQISQYSQCIIKPLTTMLLGIHLCDQGSRPLPGELKGKGEFPIP